MTKKKRRSKKLTQKVIEECLRRGAERANALDKKLKKAFQLTSEQWNMILD
jgi:hypothetical protein